MLDEPLNCTVSATDGAARRGTVETLRGAIETPVFMPVGTVAAVKALTLDQLRELALPITFCNTYRAMLRPGVELTEQRRGLHKFMRWDRPVLTDSGGFQVSSLSQIRKIREEGVEFQSHIDGSKHSLSPETSVGIQCRMG